VSAFKRPEHEAAAKMHGDSRIRPVPIAPRIPEPLDREQMNVTRIVATPRSVWQ